MTPPSYAFLVVGPAWVGDMVMAQSLFMRLREAYPEAAIDVLAPAWTAPLIERMPEVRRAIAMPLGHGKLELATRYRLGVTLRPARYARAYLLPNSLKSAITPFFARIPRRIGYVGEFRYGLLNDARRLDKQRLRMTVQRFVALAEDASETTAPTCPAPRLRVDPAQHAQALAKHSLDPAAGPVLALCPGAEYGPAKRWPPEHFAEVARARLAAGWQVWLFGSGKDTEPCAEIDALTGGRCHNLAGKTSLAEAVDLMSAATAVVSNDSGLMHVAAALDRPLVALYGSSDPGFTPPLSARAAILSLRLPCSPCFQRECPLGHLDCLRKLMPAQVQSALDGLLA